MVVLLNRLWHVYIFSYASLKIRQRCLDEGDRAHVSNVDIRAHAHILSEETVGLVE